MSFKNNYICFMNENLYGWLFTYNPHTENWRTCKREDYLKFFSSPETEFIRSKNLNTLIEIIIKTQGDEDKIKKLISE